MVTLYQHTNYEGKNITVAFGDVPDLRQFGWNDCISSIRINGHSVLLFEHIHFQGRSRLINCDIPCLDGGWNDIVSSLKVTK
jgi:hypothetical protein